jgi:hypothetical protein
VAVSIAKAEYIATCLDSSEVVWLRKFLAGLFDLELEVICIWCDNQSCIKLSKNPMFHDKSKNIEIRYHYIIYMVQRGVVRLQYMAKYEQVVGVLTKPLSWVKYEYLRDKLGVVRKDFPHEREKCVANENPGSNMV